MKFVNKLEMLGGVIVLCIVGAGIYRVWQYMPIVGMVCLWTVGTLLSFGVLYLVGLGSTHLAHRVIDVMHHYHKPHIEHLGEHGALVSQRGKVVTVQPYYAPLPERTYRALPSPRITQEDTSEQNSKPPLLLDGLEQPTMRALMNSLQEDRLQVAPGIRGTDGKPLVLSIPRAVHFKLIGSSGFGKSCLAGALLKQAITTNSPERLQIALLDLEHKTSRLFENSPNVATLRVGRRLIEMVATDADEVARHLGYLKIELDRRAELSEQELQYEPLLLIYVEEMLSLQYEVDEQLLAQMFKDLSILAVRARKYGMFLLACAQTDYSTPELKTAQKQFRSRMAFAIDLSAARAAGFMNSELIKYSFSHSTPGDGLYVLETPGVASLMLAPEYDVESELLNLESRSQRRSATAQVPFNVRSISSAERIVNADEPACALGSRRSENSLNVEKLLAMNWKKQAIIEKVWDVKKGGSHAYKNACAEYETIIAELNRESEAVSE